MTGFLRIVREVLINVALPFAIYSWVQPRYGDVNGLMAASALPVLWSLFEFARHRRVDALSLLVLFGIGLSLLAYLGGGSVKLLQLREKLSTIAVAVLFLGSAIIGRPLMYPLARAFLRRSNDSRLEEVERLREEKGFRRVMTIMTIVWGLGLLADGAASIALVYLLPIKTYLIVNPILGYATIGILSLWNVLYGRRTRRAREAEAKRA